MHPVSTALFLLGYALAIPIAAKMTVIVERQSRLALAGHQVGILIAALGWVMRGSILVAVGHALWLLVAYLWFTYLGPGTRATAIKKTASTQRRRWTQRGGSTG